MNKEALEALEFLAPESNKTYGDKEWVKKYTECKDKVIEALTQEVSNHQLNEDLDYILSNMWDGDDIVLRNNILGVSQRIRDYINKPKEVSKDTNVEEVMGAFNYISNFSCFHNGAYKDKLDTIRNYITNVPKEVDDEDIQQMLSSLLVDALLGCDAQTDNEAKREIMKNRVVKNINTLTDLLITKDVPNQSAKDIKPPVMVLKTNVGNCVVCDNQVTSEENYCSECGVQLKELQND